MVFLNGTAQIESRSFAHIPESDTYMMPMSKETVEDVADFRWVAIESPFRDVFGALRCLVVSKSDQMPSHAVEGESIRQLA